MGDDAKCVATEPMAVGPESVEMLRAERDAAREDAIASRLDANVAERAAERLEAELAAERARADALVAALPLPIFGASWSNTPEQNWAAPLRAILAARKERS